MFFKIYNVPVNSNKTIIREVVAAAMLGEDKDGKRELFIVTEDITVYPFFHEETFHDKVKEQLTMDLIAYGYTPLPDKLERIEFDLMKKIRRACTRNHRRKLQFKKEWELQKKIIEKVTDATGTNDQNKLVAG